MDSPNWYDYYHEDGTPKFKKETTLSNKDLITPEQIIKDFINKDSTCKHEDDGGFLFARCKKCKRSLDDFY